MKKMDVAVVHNIYFLLFLLSSMGFFDFLLESLTIVTISQIFHHQTIYQTIYGTLFTLEQLVTHLFHFEFQPKSLTGNVHKIQT